MGGFFEIEASLVGQLVRPQPNETNQSFPGALPLLESGVTWKLDSLRNVMAPPYLTLLLRSRGFHFTDHHLITYSDDRLRGKGLGGFALDSSVRGSLLHHSSKFHRPLMLVLSIFLVIRS